MKRIHAVGIITILGLALFSPGLADAQSRLMIVRTPAAPVVDGILEEPAWKTAPSLVLKHFSSRDGSECSVRLLWDDDALYAAFEVTDQRIETSDMDWNDDNVSISFLVDGTLRKYRFDIGGTGEGTGHRAAGRLMPGSTIDNNTDLDRGFTVEISIPWSALGVEPRAGLALPVEVLSVDHDNGPGLPYDGPGVRFSKVSLDKDQNIDTVKKSFRLVREQTGDVGSQVFEIERGRPADWILCGPFPTESLDGEALPGEAELQPRAGGEAAPGKAWRILSAPDLDLTSPEAFGAFDDAVVYIATYVQSPIEQEALLLVGSDDGVKIWVNGRCAWRNDAARPVIPDEDRVHVRLKKGWNRILFKVKQIGGGCGLAARFAAPDGRELEGLKGALAPQE